jgi:hypothetical protein
MAALPDAAPMTRLERINRLRDLVDILAQGHSAGFALSAAMAARINREIESLCQPRPLGRRWTDAPE